MKIKKISVENKIFGLLLDVVKNKTPNTVLRVAGGWVRDKLLDKDSHDIDISLNNMSGEQFANIVEDYMKEKGIHTKGVSVVKANPDQSKHLATAMINIFGLPIDFVNLRKETYAESRIPTVEPGTPEEDARRRDLTINSLFYNLNEDKIEDYVDGLEDLKNKVIRTPIDPLQTFIDDPLRILRTIRFASKYKFDVVNEILEAANNKKVQDAFRSKVSAERIWKELAGQAELEGWKSGFLTGPDPHKAAQLLGHMGLRDILFGLNEKEQRQLNLSKGVSFGKHHDLSVWEHTLKVLEFLVKHETSEEQKSRTEDYLVRNISALLHDIGCEVELQHHAESSAKIAEYILDRMKAPKNISKRVVRLVKEHMRPHEMTNISDKGLRIFIKDLEDDWRHSLELAIADIHAPNARDKYDVLIKRIDELIAQMGGTKAKPPIAGNDLIQMGFKSGPEMGKALRALQEKLLETPNMSKEEAIEFIKSLNLI
jgi:tRNA nucleotidyltransferase (CCA-adding enzyme)